MKKEPRVVKTEKELLEENLIAIKEKIIIQGVEERYMQRQFISGNKQIGLQLGGIQAGIKDLKERQKFVEELLGEKK